jgi:hypothetical protein
MPIERFVSIASAIAIKRATRERGLNRRTGHASAQNLIDFDTPGNVAVSIELRYHRHVGRLRQTVL